MRFLSAIYSLRSVSALILFGGLMVGCAPDPVYRLSAHAPDSTGFWQQGRQVVTRTVDSVQVAAAYARTTDDGHTFRLAFVNRSASPVTVDPTDVYAVTTKKLGDNQHVQRVQTAEDTDGVPRYKLVPDTVRTADTLLARNPEQVLLQIDKERAREEAEAESDAAAYTFFLTLDAVSEIASPPQSPEERTADATEDTESQLERAKARAESRRTKARLGQRRARWARSALRRTTLVPGMRTTGFVVVPVDPKAARLVLHVDLGSQVVTVPFRQRRYEP